MVGWVVPGKGGEIAARKASGECKEFMGKRARTAYDKEDKVNAACGKFATSMTRVNDPVVDSMCNTLATSDNAVVDRIGKMSADAAKKLLDDIDEAPNRAFERVLKIAVPALIPEARALASRIEHMQQAMVAIEDAFTIGFTKQYYANGRFDMAGFISAVEKHHEDLEEDIRKQAITHQLEQQMMAQLNVERERLRQELLRETQPTGNTAMDM